jgi:hypothetical protein
MARGHSRHFFSVRPHRLTTFLEINQEYGVALAFPLNIDLLTMVDRLVLGQCVNPQNPRTCWNLNGDSLPVLHDSSDGLLLQPETLALSTQTLRTYLSVGALPMAREQSGSMVTRKRGSNIGYSVVNGRCATAYAR